MDWERIVFYMDKMTATEDNNNNFKNAVELFLCSVYNMCVAGFRPSVAQRNELNAKITYDTAKNINFFMIHYTVNYEMKNIPILLRCRSGIQCLVDTFGVNKIIRKTILASSLHFKKIIERDKYYIMNCLNEADLTKHYRLPNSHKWWPYQNRDQSVMLIRVFATINYGNYEKFIEYVPWILDLNCRTRMLSTMLISACYNGRTSMVYFLLEQYREKSEWIVDVNLTTYKNWSALTHAAFKGFTDIVTILLISGANPNIITSNGSSPLTIALNGSHVTTALVLEEHGANLNHRDSKGETAAAIALRLKLDKVIKAWML